LRYTLGGPLDGTMAEYMRIDAESAVRIPDFLSDEEAATLPCAALTAWSAIVSEGRVQAGDTVLVQGTGGVALFALQFAKAQGARGKPAKALAGGDGIDHILELGGQQTLSQSIRAIRPAGTISLIGVLSGNRMDIPLGPIVTRQIRMQGITVGSRDGFEAMVKAIALHRIRPVVDSIFAFDDLHPALAYLKSGQHFGKICIRHDA
jgi:NADPH:quinone reductase-like Zn-dependent oxidoreductase